jgi:3D (Asp-Asp-Asp) domain-containing protein
MKKETRVKIVKAFFKYLTPTVLLLVGFYFILLTIEGSIKKQENYECLNWQRQAVEYPQFYLTGWQTDQCEDLGIKVFIEKGSVPIEEKISAVVFAYNSEIGQTDDRPFEMASGKKVYDGAIACPDKYELGTKVEYADRIYTCEDRMAERYRDKNYFDIWMPEKHQALEWGVQTLELSIYK